MCIRSVDTLFCSECTMGSLRGMRLEAGQILTCCRPLVTRVCLTHCLAAIVPWEPRSIQALATFDISDSWFTVDVLTPCTPVCPAAVYRRAKWRDGAMFGPRALRKQVQVSFSVNEHRWDWTAAKLAARVPRETCLWTPGNALPSRF